MNNTKNKNMIKFSLVYIILGMSMAERVCGMDSEEITTSSFTPDIFEAIMDTNSGESFIKGLCDGKNSWTVEKGGVCGGICCAKPKKDWVIKTHSSGTGQINLFDFLLGVFQCEKDSNSVKVKVKKDNFPLNVSCFFYLGLGKVLADHFKDMVFVKKNGKWVFSTYLIEESDMNQD